jgi:hypothetical protein
MDDKVLREFLLKEVEITQDVINRMGTNSFLIKGWVIILVVASLLIGGTSYYHYVAFLPMANVLVSRRLFSEVGEALSYVIRLADKESRN